MLTEAQKVAIEQAQRGNWKPANELELAHINNFVSPDCGDICMCGEECRDCGVLTGEKCVDSYKAIRLERGGAPDGQIAIEWSCGLVTDIDGMPLPTEDDDA